MNFSQSLELQAGFLDTVQESSLQTSWLRYSESKISNSDLTATVIDQQITTKMLPVEAQIEQRSTQVLFDGAMPTMTASSQQERLRYESPWTSFEFTRQTVTSSTPADPLTLSATLEVTAPSMTVEQQSWNVSFPAGNDLSVKHAVQSQILSDAQATVISSTEQWSFNLGDMKTQSSQLNIFAVDIGTSLIESHQSVVQVDALTSTAAIWNAQESSWTLNAGNGTTMTVTSTKMDATQPLSTLPAASADIQPLSNGLNLSSSLSSWTLESELFSQSVSYSKQSVLQSPSSLDLGLDGSISPSNVVWENEVWNSSQRMETPMGSLQFDRTLSLTRGEMTLDSSPALELEQPTSLLADRSLMTCELSPSLSLEVSRVETLASALPDFTLQNAQPSALGLLSVGMG